MIIPVNYEYGKYQCWDLANINVIFKPWCKIYIDIHCIVSCTTVINNYNRVIGRQDY